MKWCLDPASGGDCQCQVVLVLSALGPGPSHVLLSVPGSVLTSAILLVRYYRHCGQDLLRFEEPMEMFAKHQEKMLAPNYVKKRAKIIIYKMKHFST